MNNVFFYLKLSAIFAWVLIASFIGLVECLWRFRDPGHQARCARRIGRGILWITRTEIKLINPENLEAQRPCIYLANHQSAFDVAIFGSFLPLGAVAIAKKEILFVPLLGWLFVLTGGVRLHRKKRDRALSQLARAAEEIRRKNRSVIMMPEGTRNRSGVGLLPFKKGAFHLAVQANIPVVPIVAESLAQKVNFATKTFKPGTIHVTVMPPIASHPYTEDAIEPFVELVRNKMLEGFRSGDKMHGR